MQGASPLAFPRLSRKRHGLNLQNKYPMGGLPFWLLAYPAFSLLFCPIPPFPDGEGGNQCYFMQGASPLASPGAEPGRHWNREANHAPGGGLVSGVGGSTCRCGTRRGRVFSLPLPPPPLVLILPPSPHPPSPREGGDFWFSYARGFAPCIPGAERARHWHCPLETESWGFAGAAETRAAKKPASRKAPVWKDL